VQPEYGETIADEAIHGQVPDYMIGSSFGSIIGADDPMRDFNVVDAASFSSSIPGVRLLSPAMGSETPVARPDRPGDPAADGAQRALDLSAAGTADVPASERQLTDLR
jgi:hypothetical protein